MKNIKRTFIYCYDVFKIGLRRFAWNPTIKMCDTRPKAWYTQLRLVYLLIVVQRNVHIGRCHILNIFEYIGHLEANK